ncbi:MAG: peptide chain release factor 1 [Gemmatimonadales bacterium]
MRPGGWSVSGSVTELIATISRLRSNEGLDARLKAALDRAEAVERELADPQTVSDPEKLKALGREHARLERVRKAAEALRRAAEEMRQAEELVGDDDPALAELARADVERLGPHVEDLQGRLRELLVPSDPLDNRDTIVEIRAGTGGDEAALFASDLVRMYTRYAERRGWTVETVSVSPATLGGVREAVFRVRGENAYGRLRHESGVHRVQRVPVTEAQGRIHTSAATVAVLPEAEEVDIRVDEGDLKIDVFRSSGPGGQSVNTTDSAVRITHVPTGLVVQCQDQKSQLQNKQRALEVLRARLLDRKIAEQEAARARERRAMVGTGDRSAKIRTYNFPQNRVTDHRINVTLHQLDEVLDGELDSLIDQIKLAYQEEGADG